MVDQQMRSFLLLDEPVLTVYPSLAVAIGLEQAVILQQVHFWLKQKKNLRDGRYWVYNTYDQWHEQFPFIAIRSLKRIIPQMEEDGLLISGNYNQHKTDRTKWYTINYEHPILLGLTPLSESVRPSGQNGTMARGQNGTISDPGRPSPSGQSGTMDEPERHHGSGRSGTKVVPERHPLDSAIPDRSVPKITNTTSKNTKDGASASDFGLNGGSSEADPILATFLGLKGQPTTTFGEQSSRIRRGAGKLLGELLPAMEHEWRMLHKDEAPAQSGFLADLERRIHTKKNGHR